MSSTEGANYLVRPCECRLQGVVVNTLHCGSHGCIPRTLAIPYIDTLASYALPKHLIVYDRSVYDHERALIECVQTAHT